MFRAPVRLSFETSGNRAHRRNGCDKKPITNVGGRPLPLLQTYASSEALEIQGELVMPPLPAVAFAVERRFEIEGENSLKCWTLTLYVFSFLSSAPKAAPSMRNFQPHQFKLTDARGGRR